MSPDEQAAYARVSEATKARSVRRAAQIKEEIAKLEEARAAEVERRKREHEAKKDAEYDARVILKTSEAIIAALAETMRPPYNGTLSFTDDATKNAVVDWLRSCGLKVVDDKSTVTYGVVTTR